MLTRKHISISLLTLLALASLTLISPVKATTYFAEMPPYEDKWTLTAGSNDPYADADLSTGRLAVFMYPFTTEDSSAQVKTWKRVWLPATDLEISYSWKLKGYLMCGFWLSYTGVDLYIFVEKSLNSGTIHETMLFERYVDLVFEYQEPIDIPWQSPDPIVVSIPEAGYYNIGAGLAGEAGGLLASCVFGGEEDWGASVSMKLRYTCAVYWDSNGHGTINVELPDRTMHLHDCLPTTTFHDAGTPARITATPDPHYCFNHWELDGVTNYADNLELVLYEDHSVKAYFSWVNHAPNTPSLTGPNYGYVGVPFTYRACATDPDDGDSVKYTFYWGDGSTSTTGYYGSGVEVSRSHSWSSTGTYSVKVKATDVYGAYKYSSSLTVTVYSAGGCPTLFVWNGAEYVCEGLLDIHNPDGIDVVASHVLIHTPELVEHRYLMRLTEHPQTHSHIDQVQLFATLKDGTEIKLPLISAIHSEDGNVKQELSLSDDVRADTLGADHNNGTSEYIDLEFVAPEGLEIETFTFIIEGHNILVK